MIKMPEQEIILKMNLVKEEKASKMKTSKYFRMNLRKVPQMEGSPVIKGWWN